jgi:hypothetical protein
VRNSASKKQNTLSDTLIKLDMCRRQVEKKKYEEMDSAFRNSIQKLKEDSDGKV